MKEDKTYNIMVDEEVKVLEIRHGEAIDPIRKRVTNITGKIVTPCKYIEKRQSEIDISKALLIVNDNEFTIELLVNQFDREGDRIAGQLKLDGRLLKFGINTNKSYTTFELANLIKMNRSYFETKDKAMQLVSELVAFKAKVSRDIEKMNDGRGNKTDLLNQVVNSNLPDNFKLCIPIFEGCKHQNLEVEIYIKADDLSCQLISADLDHLIDEASKDIINVQICEILGIKPDLVVIHI